MSKFDPKKCVIPDIWCGEGDYTSQKAKDNRIYVRNGSKLECLKKGVGAGKYQVQKEHLSQDSLRNIKYVGEKHSLAFSKKKINSTRALITKVKKLTPNGVDVFLNSVLTKSDGVLDRRAYNSILLFLYYSGLEDHLPVCKKIKIP